jgi:4'-phosphopantetheinyl transferase EntD
VGPIDRYAGLGLDLEIDGSVVAETRARVLTARELHDCSIDAELDLATLFFSAKESVYKATFPATGQWLDFDQVEVRIEADAGVFTARIDRTADHDLAGTVLRGRFAHVSGHVMSMTTLVGP